LFRVSVTIVTLTRNKSRLLTANPASTGKGGQGGSGWHDAVMDIEAFWGTIESAQAAAGSGGQLHEALADDLASRDGQEILDFQDRFDQARNGIFRWDVWAAAYLINGGCSDDGFWYFTAWVIAEGRDWYQKVLASPDSLAGHPAVISAADEGDAELEDEAAGYAAATAYERVTDGADLYEAQRARGEGIRFYDDMGEQFDFDDDEQMSRRLPRLWALFAE
jgi:hypothetical protein